MNVLVDDKTNRVINTGDKVVTFRGEECHVLGFQEPRNGCSTGRVNLLFGNGSQQSYYPSVIDAHWIDVVYAEPDCDN